MLETVPVEARRENAETLASVLGLSRESATQVLDLAVVVSARVEDAIAQWVAHSVCELLSRTVREASTSPVACAAELIIGDAAAQTDAPKVYLRIESERAVLETCLTSQRQQPCTVIPHIVALLTSCYASGALLRRATSDVLPFTAPDPFVVAFAELGIDSGALSGNLNLGHAYLVGAGAIGNGFMWAARHLNLVGRLEIVDDDVISPGNLNRQIWFGRDDIGRPKAQRLAELTQPFFPHLELAPRQSRLQDLPDRTDGPWLEKLIVAVDSRRARRELQNEIPGEVFDASTTDIREIVIHHHRQPNAQACLSCIYEADAGEYTREKHIAEHLGVSVDEVRSERISPPSAAVIASRFPSIPLQAITGRAYDSFYKALCAEKELGPAADTRVVAPFAFVSVLAGTLLALELVRRLAAGENTITDNYWRVSPWHAPLARRRILRPKQPYCAFCGNPTMSKLSSTLWSER